MAQEIFEKKVHPSPNPTLNEKCFNFFKDKAEEEGDVLFIVGSEKEKIKAFKLLLRITSPVFDRQFSSTWDTTNPIEIPDIQPKIFRIFLKLMLDNEMKSEYLNELNLSLDDIFQLLYTCKKYDMTHICAGIFSYLHHRRTNGNAIYIYEKIEMLANDPKISTMFFTHIEKNFLEIMKTKENYKEMSRDTLRQILQSDNIIVTELDLFQVVCSWASIQCQNENLDVTGGNLREIIGDLLYLIRFPVMSREEFTENVIPRKILTSDETLSVLMYITTPEEKRTLEQVNGLIFKTVPVNFGFSGPFNNSMFNKFEEIFNSNDE